jgi:hypothetical protein
LDDPIENGLINNSAELLCGFMELVGWR